MLQDPNQLKQIMAKNAEQILFAGRGIVLVWPQAEPTSLDQLVNGFHVGCFLESPFLNMVPPFEYEIIHNKSEPRGQFYTLLPSICFPQNFFQLPSVHVFNICNLIGVRMHADIPHNEEKIVNCENKTN